MGALMSCGYCGIAVTMSLLAVARDSVAPAARPEGQLSQADYVFGVFNALGGVAFTFGGAHRGAAACARLV